MEDKVINLPDRGKGKKIEAVINNFSDGIMILYKNFEKFFLNEKAKAILDYPKDKYELLNNLRNNIFYDSSNKIIKFEDIPINRVLRGEILNDVHVSIPMSNDNKYFSINGSPVYDNVGNVEKAILCFRENTEQIKRDKLMRQQKEELEIILNNISDIIVIVNDKEEVIKTNKSTNDNIKNWLLIKSKHYSIDGSNIPDRQYPIKKLMRGEKFSKFKVSIEYENNKILYYEVSAKPIYNKHGQFDIGILVYHDITDNLNYEQNALIKTQYELADNIIANLELALFRLSYPEFKVIDLNNKAFKLLKQVYNNLNYDSPKSIRGKDIFDFYKGKDVNKEMFDDISFNSFSKIINYECDDDEIYLELIFKPLYGISKQITEIIVICIDVTEYVKGKNEMEKALKIQDELFVNVSHELKTPLNIIYSAIQLMEVYTKNDNSNKMKINKSINSIKQNCYRLTRLINNILDVSRIEAGYLKINITNANIVNVVKDLVTSVTDFIKEKGLKVIFESNTDEKMIACDVVKIERVMLNLISNAIKFTNPGGSLFISVIDKEDTVEIIVRDTGIGIDKQYLDSIFKRFSQIDKSLSRNTEGSGIGLSLIKSLVEMQGGKIIVKSEIGIGSEFIVSLPSKILENDKKNKYINSENKTEMINIEFSDIYERGWN